MRQTFIQTLVELARNDPRIILLTGDLGFMALEPFREEFPERFVNCGVAEQNMVGVAAGLAESGFLPFFYSIVPFATLRGYEFIRNGIAAHRLPVRIVGVGGGVEYGTNGISHYGLEDVGVMRLLPSMRILCPADAGQAETILRETWNLDGPTYYRLGKDERAVVPGLDKRFQIGEPQMLAEGTDVLLISMGPIAIEVAKARDLLSQQGIETGHWCVASIEPFPAAQVSAALRSYSSVVTVEAHRTTGGLGTAVAEIAASKGNSARVLRLGIDLSLDGRSGSQAYLHDRYGVSAAAIADTVLQKCIGGKQKVGFSG